LRGRDGARRSIHDFAKAATALLLADLGVTKSHSRPQTSNDNPFSEGYFKSMKYQPQFPRRFGCIQADFCLQCKRRRPMT
jgi:transposase InsO family protein